MIKYRYNDTDEIFDTYDEAVEEAIQYVPDSYYEDALLQTYNIGEILNAICVGNPSVWEDIITRAEMDWLEDSIEEVEVDDDEDEI